jgi:hypothetical protein
MNKWIGISVIFLFYSCATDSLNISGRDMGPAPNRPDPKISDILGPQSQQATGKIRLLVIPVRFQDAEPQLNLNQIKTKAVVWLNDYVRDQSYGRACIEAKMTGWTSLPDPLSSYRVSSNNFKVDRNRVRKLIEDAMTGVESEIDFSNFQHMLIVPGVFTVSDRGYGMVCYCANPGMLTGVRRNPGYMTLRSKGGREFSGGIFVGAENSHLGMFAHDFFHALGGVYAKQRLVP